MTKSLWHNPNPPFHDTQPLRPTETTSVPLSQPAPNSLSVWHLTTWAWKQLVLLPRSYTSTCLLPDWWTTTSLTQLQFFTPKTPAIFHSKASNQRLHLESPQLQQTPQNSDAAAAALERGEEMEMAMAMLVMVRLWWKGGRERESSRREGEWEEYLS